MRVRRRTADRRIFFPWEGRRGPVRWLRQGPLRPAIGVALVVLFMGAVGAEERREAGVRQTRARLLVVYRAVDTYLADHKGECPQSLADVARYARFEGAPLDAWGRPLRLICPGGREDTAYVLMSDGPDGRPGGLDRIE
ncbi:MAG: type II secretion system protein GspG [Polyangiaceae bacterium]|nr:type II secretion system protein GspG [Polyangiaceae bacterium]